MEKFYFTFGSAEHYPYQRGWVEIEAKTEKDARAIFQIYFPGEHKDILNCAFVYNQAQFEQTSMGKGLYADEFCHAKITLRERKVRTKVVLLHRDESNYKDFCEVVLEGKLPKEKKQEIFDCCDSGEFFIPAQVGLEEMADDNPWYELAELSETTEPATVAITAEELYRRFRRAKGNWGM